MLNSKRYWSVGIVLVIACTIFFLRNWDDLMVTQANKAAWGYSQVNLSEAIARVDKHDSFAQYIINKEKQNDMLYIGSLLRYSLYRRAAATNEAVVEFAKLKYCLIQRSQLRKESISEMARGCDELSGDVMYYHVGRRLIKDEEGRFHQQRAANCQGKKSQLFNEHHQIYKVRGALEPVAPNVYQLMCSGPTNCLALVDAVSPCRYNSVVVKSVTRADGKEINYNISEHDSEDQSNGNLSIDFFDMDGVSSVYTVVIDKLVAGPGVHAVPK